MLSIELEPLDALDDYETMVTMLSTTVDSLLLANPEYGHVLAPEDSDDRQDLVSQAGKSCHQVLEAFDELSEAVPNTKEDLVLQTSASLLKIFKVVRLKTKESKLSVLARVLYKAYQAECDQVDERNDTIYDLNKQLRVATDVVKMMHKTENENRMKIQRLTKQLEDLQEANKYAELQAEALRKKCRRN